MCGVDPVVRGETESAPDLAGHVVEDKEVVSESESAPAEEGMIVRSEAKVVAWLVGSVVRVA